ncbi:MAG TPA: hypothetical protein VIF32_02130 [Gemmatimonadaceae bacterium]|jgi:hypothetical protein
MTAGARPPVTIRDWITIRTTRAPAALQQQILTTLGSDADAPESRTPELCLASAARALDALLSESRFGRDHARELLAIDALTTLAFEYASQTADSRDDLAALATLSARTLGQLATQRV